MNFGEILVLVVTFFGLYTSIFFFLTLWENKKELKNPQTKTYPSVAVIVPAYNEEKTLAATIESLLGLNYPKDKLEIHIVDDGSTDSTYEVAKKFIQPGVFVYTKKNGGKATAMNYALKRIKTDFVGALDADSFVDPRALQRLIGYFKNKKVMAVTPSMKVFEPKKFLQKVQHIEYLIGIFLRKVFAFLGSIHVTPGPFTIYRKWFFDTYGGFDEGNITEDQEMAMRIQKHNFEIENSIDAFVYTVAPTDLKTLNKQRLRWYRGFISNCLRYKKLFTPSHGNLGVFVLPGSFFSVFLVIISAIYFVIKTIQDGIKQFTYAKSVGFDIFQLNWSFDSFFLNLSGSALLAFLSILIGVSILWAAKKLSNEKYSVSISYIWYVLVYWFLFAVWWSWAFIYTIGNKKVSWGHKSVVK